MNNFCWNIFWKMFVQIYFEWTYFGRTFFLQIVQTKLQFLLVKLFSVLNITENVDLCSISVKFVLIWKFRIIWFFNAKIFFWTVKGKLPSNQRVTWRKDSALKDKGNKGEDLTGGYYDGNKKRFCFNSIRIKLTRKGCF